MTDTLPALPSLGVVAIGRNEGERLRRCLESVAGVARAVVYVDSGSTDGSVEMARAMGVEVVLLDPGRPFTAARARNEGFRRLREVLPGLDYVQFVDGDCEVVRDWLRKAGEFLDARPDISVVCGRRRERHPERSVYNMLCDIEWDGPAGETSAGGGDVLMRVAAFEAVNGYRADLIAGEDPDLYLRLRTSGWRLWRLPDEMTMHDAAMLRFSQWWKRTVRTGYAYAQGVALHGASPERHFVREWRSAWLWGLGVPLLTLCLVALAGVWALLLLLVYPLQVVRLAARGGRSARENWWRALFLVIAKFPEMLGQFKYLVRQQHGGPSRLIEYK